MDTAFAPDEAAPDLSCVLAAHRKTRKDLARYVQAVDTAVEADRMTRLRPLARWARRFAHEQVHHHRREDDILFPALRERVPALDDVIDGLASDTAGTHELFARWPAVADRLADRSIPFGPAKAEAQVLVTAIQQRVQHRLDIEEAHIFPALAANFGAAEYDRLAARAQRHRPPRSFVAPWSSHAVEPADRAGQAKAAARPRLVWTLDNGRYERLVTTAFGHGHGHVGHQPAIAVSS